MKRSYSMRMACAFLCFAFTLAFFFGANIRTYAGVECGCTTYAQYPSGTGDSDESYWGTGYDSTYCTDDSCTDSQGDVFETEDGFEYQIWGGDVVIVGYKGSNQNVVVPADIDGYTVTEIGNEAFKGHFDIVSVALPQALNVIGQEAFYECINLCCINLPEGLCCIGEYAFAECKSLVSVSLPAEVKELSSHAFYRCESLESLTLNEALEKIGGFAFTDCKALKEVYIPKNVTSIGRYAFNGSGIVDLIIPKGVSTIEAQAFNECADLSSITVEDGNEKYISEGNCLIDTSEDLLVVGCKNSVIPGDKVKAIGESAFAGCDAITEMSIPDEVYKIGLAAFSECVNLASLKLPKNLKTIDFSAFYGCKSLTNVTLPQGLSDVGANAFYGCDLLGEITIPDSVVSIGVQAFYSCDSLQTVVIGANVAAIGGKAFAACSALSQITVSKSNTTFCSVSNCVIDKAQETLVLGIKTSVIPDDGSVTVIATDAFFENDSLESIFIPDSVTTIRFDAFAFCTGLKTLHIGKGVSNLGVNAFRGCLSLEKITVDDGNAVFYDIDNCVVEKSTKTLILGCQTSRIPADNSVTTIGFGAFSGCGKLSSIAIPLSISTIANQAFLNCSMLESVCFSGSDEQWDQINIGQDNDALINARAFFDRTQKIVRGDASDDETIDSADAVFVLRFDSGSFEFSEVQLFAADINGDGEVNSGDASVILKLDAGVLQKF